MKLPALSGLFHNLIACCSLQLLNVPLQAFACDTSLSHNYNNYVPMRRSTKMTSEMTWEVGGRREPPWVEGVFPGKRQKGKAEMTFKCPKTTFPGHV